MRLLITRPRDDAEPLARVLRDRGIEPIMEPLLTIEVLPGPPLDLDGVQAILVTSANGVRALAARDGRRHLPMFAVGDASARAAAEAGFAKVESAAGDVDALARLVTRTLKPGGGALVHVAGSTVAGDLSGHLSEAGFACRREVLYRAQKAESLSAATVAALNAGAMHGVVLYSPRTAGTFCQLIDRAGLAESCRDLKAFCLSPAVAAKAEAVAWREILVAARPDQAALLDLIDRERAVQR